jgi:hypothetical protein
MGGSLAGANGKTGQGGVVIVRYQYAKA